MELHLPGKIAYYGVGIAIVAALGFKVVNHIQTQKITAKPPTSDINGCEEVKEVQNICRISPKSICIHDNGDGTYTGIGRATNRCRQTVNLDLSEFRFRSGDRSRCASPDDCGQPLSFSQDTYFSVVFSGAEAIVWKMCDTVTMFHKDQEPQCHPTHITLLCGNGVQEINEECDDGNEVDGDDCSNSCMLCKKPTTVANLVKQTDGDDKVELFAIDFGYSNKDVCDPTECSATIICGEEKVPVSRGQSLKILPTESEKEEPDCQIVQDEENTDLVFEGAPILKATCVNSAGEMTATGTIVL